MAPTALPDMAFSQQPNVYLVGFDGLTPAALLGRLGTDSTPFHDLMSGRFRTFRNFFSNHRHTLGLYHELLSLADDGFQSTLTGDVALFSGTHDAPLFRIFRRNGYEVTTLYMDHYFGERRGPYVDNYITPITPDFELVCTKLDRSLLQISFYGYCAIRPLLEPIWPVIDSGANRRIVERLLQRGALRKPQLVVAHIYSPGHTGFDFDMDDDAHMARFRNRYLKATEFSARLLTRILNHLEAHDPSAILFVFGDHGPWLTRSLNSDENWPLTITDRQATLGGIFPPQRCAQHLAPPTQRTANYTTTLDVAYSIIRCLTSESDKHLATRFERTEWQVPDHEHLAYGDFLYE